MFGNFVILLTVLLLQLGHLFLEFAQLNVIEIVVGEEDGFFGVSG